MKKILISAVLLAFAYIAWADAAKDDAVLNAMRKELSRSFEKLKNAESAPLYYLDYEVTDSKEYALTAVLGAITSDEQTHARYLDVDARAGSYSLDNTHEIKGKNAWMNDIPEDKTNIPVEDDEDSLRNAIWLKTDRAYKAAQERHTKVQMNKAVTALEEDASDDFSKEGKAEKFYETADFPALDKDILRKKVKKYSLKFKEHSFIFNSYVYFGARTSNRYFISSEGSEIKTGNTYIRLNYYLSTRTDDGMDLVRRKSYDANRMEDMPSDDIVLRDIRESVKELEALKNAPLVDPYVGPAILKNRACGVYFHEIFGHRIEGHRQKSENASQTFAKKLNEPVVSALISVYDDPAIEYRNGQFLRGYYKYDDEGIKARRVILVDRGILKGFLMNRSPIKSFPVSNGHGRREPGYASVARQGSLIIEADKRVTYQQLRKRLIEECKKQKKAYGLLFEDISGGFTNVGRQGTQAFKVIPLLVYRIYADGRPDEVVRGVDMVGTPLAGFNKIIAAADDEDVFNGSCGAESGWVPVSAILNAEVRR